MIPEIFRLHITDTFSIPVYSFGLMILCCFIGAMKLLEVCLKNYGKDPLLAEPMVTVGAISGIVGARLFSILSNFNEFLADPLTTLFSSAGFVYYGGFIGGVLGVIVFLYRKGESWIEYANIVAAPLAFGYAIGRLGCQLSGDGDYGSATSSFFSMDYAYGVIPTKELVHPTPFYESVAAMCITLILCSEKIRTMFSGYGKLFGLYLVMTSISRFLVEYARVEPRILSGFTQAQLISLVLIPIGIFLLLRTSSHSIDSRT